MAAKIFEVGDVLPATTQLRISWDYDTVIDTNSAYIKTSNLDVGSAPFYMSVNASVGVYSTSIRWDGIYRELDNKGKTGSIIINTSSSSDSDRTVTAVFTEGVIVTWEDLNAPSGYTITFNSNGGSSVSAINDVTELPTTLPTPTKSGYTFVAWYYESNFQTRAKAGDTIESNITLYAKWHNLGSLFTEIADAIRSKDGTSGTIRDVDFGERVKQIQGPKEEQTKTVSPTTSSQDVLPDANKVLSKVTVNAIPTETKSQQPDLSSGDQTINATSGKFMTSFTITKDTVNHIASNIRSGKTLYGVTGNLQPAKEEETKTVTPNFSSGNVDVTPTTGKVLSQVTINKDSNLVASNIKKDVTVHGITGTLASGGGTSLDRIGMICFSVSVLKTDSTAQTLRYWTNSNMLSKTFFTDGEGNWYLPEDVGVFFDGSHKGDADTVLTLFNGTGTFSKKSITFKVGTTPVALLLYYYRDTGYDNNGLINISWTSGTGVIFPDPNQTEFIELPSNFFDDFPYYSSSDVDYWKKENFFHFFQQGRVGYSSVRLESGWYLETFD